MTCLHEKLENIRPWPGEGFSIGECCHCGSTIAVDTTKNVPELSQKSPQQPEGKLRK